MKENVVQNCIRYHQETEIWYGSLCNNRKIKSWSELSVSMSSCFNETLFDFSMLENNNILIYVYILFHCLYRVSTTKKWHWSVLHNRSYLQNYPSEFNTVLCIMFKFWIWILYSKVTAQSQGAVFWDTLYYITVHQSVHGMVSKKIFVKKLQFLKSFIMLVEKVQEPTEQGNGTWWIVMRGNTNSVILTTYWSRSCLEKTSISCCPNSVAGTVFLFHIMTISSTIYDSCSQQLILHTLYSPPGEPTTQNLVEPLQCKIGSRFNQRALIQLCHFDIRPDYNIQNNIFVSSQNDAHVGSYIILIYVPKQ